MAHIEKMVADVDLDSNGEISHLDRSCESDGFWMCLDDLGGKLLKTD